MDNKTKIFKIEIKEKTLGMDRDNKITIEEFMGKDLGSEEGFIFPKYDVFIPDIEKYLSEINQPKFHNYKNIIFNFNGKYTYHVNPHLINLKKIELVKYE